MLTTSSKVVLMILVSDIAIRRYTSRKLSVLTACQMFVELGGTPGSVPSLMISNFSTYWLRARNDVRLCIKIHTSYHSSVRDERLI